MSESLAKGSIPPRRRSAIFLPNAITTGAMLAGFWAILQAIQFNFWYACWGLFVAAILDGLDGRIARLVKGTSAFGEQYDSMADLISFGFAPAIIAYFWSLQVFGRLGMAVAFLYMTCAAIRLARFNTLIGEESSRKYFTGIPSPPATGLVGSPIMVHQAYFNGGMLDNSVLQWVYLGVVIGTGLLMVSPVRFRTFKDVRFTKYGLRLALLSAAAILAFFLAETPAAAFVSSYAYLMVGIIEGGIFYNQNKEKRAARREARRQRRIRRKLARRQAREEKAQLRAVNGSKPAGPRTGT
ncbi:MAG: CDP-diacylglycerol--serine O-phosphatidyltransferase [Deltaproteobacteria bacterium RBG_13_61_14]|nr:MAG: CDP-diacylglycerol--serine O-phosphatidyltransferase [Deltaproteobacteria bacterium RBG_13_61_14]